MIREKAAVALFAGASIALAGAAHAGPFSADFGVLYMKRGEGDAGVIVTEDGTDAPLIDSGDLTDDFVAGGELALTFKPGPWGGQLRGFMLGELNNHTGFTGVDNIIILTDPVTFYGIGEENPFDASLSTELGGGELNVLFDAAAGVEVYAGPRFMQLDEDLSLLGTFGEESSEENIWGVENRLLGAHVGATLDLASMSGMTGPLRPMLRIGGGLYSNDADGSFVVLDDGVPRDPTPVTDTGTETSYSFDLDLSVHYDVTPTASIFVGYRMLYLGDVALAPDQVAGTTSFNGDPEYSIRSGDVLFHGVKAGGVIRF